MTVGTATSIGFIENHHGSNHSAWQAFLHLMPVVEPFIPIQLANARRVHVRNARAVLVVVVQTWK